MKNLFFTQINKPSNYSFVWPLYLILNEINLMGIMYWHYKWSYLTNILMTIADFIWWILLIDNGNIDPIKISPLLMGYILWIYSYYFIYDIHYFIVDSCQTGVLEQIYLSPYPFFIKLIIRLISCLFFCTIELAIVVTTLLFIFPLTIPINLLSIPILIITLAGIAGFTFIMAGIGLVFKKSQPFAYFLNNLLLFFNGAILPIESMPKWLQIISKTLPSTQGIIVLRNITYSKQTLFNIIANGDLLALILNSLIYITGGYIIFNFCEKKVKNDGTLGHY